MNTSRVINIIGGCAVIVAVVIVGLYTVGPVAAIALGAGVGVAVFYSDARCRDARPTSNLPRAPKPPG